MVIQTNGQTVKTGGEGGEGIAPSDDNGITFPAPFPHHLGEEVIHSFS